MLVLALARATPAAALICIVYGPGCTSGEPLWPATAVTITTGVPQQQLFEVFRQVDECLNAESDTDDDASDGDDAAHDFTVDDLSPDDMLRLMA